MSRGNDGVFCPFLPQLVPFRGSGAASRRAPNRTADHALRQRCCACAVSSTSCVEAARPLRMRLAFVVALQITNFMSLAVGGGPRSRAGGACHRGLWPSNRPEELRFDALVGIERTKRHRTLRWGREGGEDAPHRLLRVFPIRDRHRMPSHDPGGERLAELRRDDRVERTHDTNTNHVGVFEPAQQTLFAGVIRHVAPNLYAWLGPSRRTS